MSWRDFKTCLRDIKEFLCSKVPKRTSRWGWTIGSDSDGNYENFILGIEWGTCAVADQDHRSDDRVYMHTGHAKNRICVSENTMLLPDSNICGLLLHEIGHIFLLEKPEIYHLLISPEDQEYLESIDQEVAADTVIDWLFGVNVRYDENKIQWFDYRLVR